MNVYNNIYILSKASFRQNYLKSRDFIFNANLWGQDEIAEYQNECVQNIVKFCYERVPYYGKLMKECGLTPSDIGNVTDLKKLPILTKQIIKANAVQFLPVGVEAQYVDGSTGGSTGEPLKYRMSKLSALYASLLLDRGFGMGGYVQGDRLAVTAGGSLVGSRKTIKTYVKERLTNVRYFSSYGMDEALLRSYSADLIKFQPKFLRGYASALNSLACYIEKNKLNSKLSIQAVFSTSEVLFQSMRSRIEDVFNCRVYDGWGLNDGGASAFECSEHNGMHVDVERSLIQLESIDGIDSDDKGRIIVTTLIDKAMPLLRYDTGDLGRLDSTPCKCGIVRPRLFIDAGRVTDYLELNGKIIGAPVLTVLMGKLPVNQYQIAKKSESLIIFRIIKDVGYTEADEKFIRKSMGERIGNIGVDIQYVDKITPPDGGKHKFIIDESNK